MGKLIIALKERKPGSKSKMDEPEEEYEDLEIAAQDIMDAIKSKDVDMLTEALRSFVEMC